MSKYKDTIFFYHFAIFIMIGLYVKYLMSQKMIYLFFFFLQNDRKGIRQGILMCLARVIGRVKGLPFREASLHPCCRQLAQVPDLRIHAAHGTSDSCPRSFHPRLFTEL